MVQVRLIRHLDAPDLPDIHGSLVVRLGIALHGSGNTRMREHAADGATQRLPRWVIIGLALLAVGCCVAGFGLAFASGCAGDLKAGALGDPRRALLLDRASGACLLGGLASAVTAITFAYYRRTRSIMGSVATFVGTMVTGGVLVTIVALELGAMGVDHCFQAAVPG